MKDMTNVKNEEVRNGTILPASTLWLVERGDWVWGISLMPNDLYGPGHVEWVPVCMDPQGEIHCIPDDFQDLKDLCTSVEPLTILGWQHNGGVRGLQGLYNRLYCMREGSGMDGAENDQLQDLVDWLEEKLDLFKR